MKQFVIALYILIGSTIVNAQILKENLFYLDAGGSVGNYIGGDLAANYIHNQKISFQFSFSHFERKDPSRPDDYSGGLSSIVSLEANTPKDELKSYSILGGFILPYKGSEKGRWNLRAGLAYSEFKEAYAYNIIDDAVSSEFFIGNYSYKKRHSEMLSIVFKPELEIAFSKYVGIGLSAFIVLNEKTTVFGLGINLKLGVLK